MMSGSVCNLNQSGEVSGFVGCISESGIIVDDVELGG